MGKKENVSKKLDHNEHCLVFTGNTQNNSCNQRMEDFEKLKVSFETEHLCIRSLEEKDKEDYMKLRVQTSPMSRVYEIMPELLDKSFEDQLNSQDDIYLSIFSKDDKLFVASGSLQNYHSTSIELGFDVLEQHRRKGIGTELLNALVMVTHRLFPEAEVIVRTDQENIACQKLMEKCGGIYVGREDSLFSRLMEVSVERLDEEYPASESWKKQREENMRLIEEGKGSVCVYRMRTGMMTSRGSMTQRCVGKITT